MKPNISWLNIFVSSFLLSLIYWNVKAAPGNNAPVFTNPKKIPIVVLSQKQQQRELDKDMERLVKFQQRGKLETQLKLFQNLEAKWSKRSSSFYYEIVDQICSELSSNYWRNDTAKAMTLLRVLAAKPLDRKEVLPVRWQLRSLSFLNEQAPQDKKPISTPQEKKVRLKRARQWLSALHSVQELAKIDLNTLPMAFLNLSVPGLEFPSGIAPEDVPDLKVRAQYKAAIAKNSALAERRNQIRNAKDLKSDYEPTALSYLVHAYKNSPDAKSELESLLQRFPIGKAWEAKLWKELDLAK